MPSHAQVLGEDASRKTLKSWEWREDEVRTRVWRWIRRLRNFALVSGSVVEIHQNMIYVMAIRMISASIWRTGCFLSRLNILIRATPVFATPLHYTPGPIFGDEYDANFNSSAEAEAEAQLVCPNLAHNQCECVVHGHVYHSEHVSEQASRSRLLGLPNKFSSAVSHLINCRSNGFHHSGKVLQDTIMSTWTNKYALGPYALPKQITAHLGENLCPYFIQAMNLSLLAHSGMAHTHEVHQQYLYKHPHHPLLQCRHYHSSTFVLAGHNKWSKIKHKKKATDLERSKNIQKFVTLIVSAIKTGGGPNPDTNVRLASVLEAARKAGTYDNHPLKCQNAFPCTVV